jgi:hypothetical protein
MDRRSPLVSPLRAIANHFDPNVSGRVVVVGYSAQRAQKGRWPIKVTLGIHIESSIVDALREHFPHASPGVALRPLIEAIAHNPTEQEAAEAMRGILFLASKARARGA